jgi:hypothetical protein
MPLVRHDDPLLCIPRDIYSYMWNVQRPIDSIIRTRGQTPHIDQILNKDIRAKQTVEDTKERDWVYETFREWNARMKIALIWRPTLRLTFRQFALSEMNSSLFHRSLRSSPPLLG